MAFLDNSGDIILDAVLTDTGRKRLARGDGSFRIAKFALGDDEIDYNLYRNSNSYLLYIIMKCLQFVSILVKIAIEARAIIVSLEAI